MFTPNWLKIWRSQDIKAAETLSEIDIMPKIAVWIRVVCHSQLTYDLNEVSRIVGQALFEIIMEFDIWIVGFICWQQNSLFNRFQITVK